MQTALKRVVADEGIPANITAGLGSVFVALGHRRLDDNGQLALVLPRALLSGVAWKETRRLLGNNYHVKYIVALRLIRPAICGPCETNEPVEKSP